MILNTTHGSDRVHRRSSMVAGLSMLACIQVLALVATGCESPYQRDAAGDLQRSVRAAVDRQIADLPPSGTLQTTVETAAPLPPEFDDRIEELQDIGPRWVAGGGEIDLGNGLDGEPLVKVSMSLENAVRGAVRNNLGIQRTRIAQSITTAEVVRAEAVFDAVLGAGTNFARLDEPSPDIIIPIPTNGPNGDPLVLEQGQNVSQWGFTTDLRKPLKSGGGIDLSYTGDRQRNLSAGTITNPDPAYQSAVRLGLSQPILQGFGEEVNTAGIQIARNADRRSMAVLRERLLEIVVAVEQAYWQVVYTRQEFEVSQWLVSEGERIRDILDNRRGFDTTLAQFADAVATVESRKTRLIRARRDVGRANDVLKAVINDPDLPVGGDFDLIPVDFMIDAPYAFDLRDSITIALSESPLIDAAILDIDDASINEIVARNGRLPSLDLRAELAWLGLAGDYGESVRNIDGDFVDYIVGLQFSQPIGNRAADSVLRQARLRRSAAVIGYRQSVQDVVLEVRTAIRDIEAGYALVGQARNFRLAQAENLRALEALRETLAALTPEFLSLLFQRQERLGEAQLQEAGSLVAYNLAIAELQKAVGTGLTANGIDLVAVDEEGAGIAPDWNGFE